MEKEREKLKAISAGTLFEMLFSLFVVVFGVLFTVSFFYGESVYIGKGEIKESIFKVINNGGDLRAVRNIYENREPLDWSIFGYEDHYDYMVPMSKILEDIRSDYFLKSKEGDEESRSHNDYNNPSYLKGSDVSSLALIDNILQENEQVNPFEGLEPAQKDNFENIRIKLSGDYDLVARDMEKLSSDLKTKNDLVSQYLKDSTTSFWVSVFALVFSLFVSIYQIYLGRDSRVKLIIASAINEAKH